MGKQEEIVRRIFGFAAVFAVVGFAWAAPITVGQTLTSQKFEWKKANPSRSAGTYGR